MNLSAEFPGVFAQLAKMKILVIDDEPANVALLEAMLAYNGLTAVKSILDSRLAVKTIADFEPDLILLDLMMPYVDGFAVLETLRSDQSELFLPVVILTADSNDESKIRALRAGATDFLLKPFDQIEVMLRIKNLLETRRVHMLLDNQRAAYEDAVCARTTELRQALADLEKAKDALAAVQTDPFSPPVRSNGGPPPHQEFARDSSCPPAARQPTRRIRTRGSRTHH
jgi:PleD family two-component response regulator